MSFSLKKHMLYTPRPSRKLVTFFTFGLLVSDYLDQLRAGDNLVSSDITADSPKASVPKAGGPDNKDES